MTRSRGKRRGTSTATLRCIEGKGKQDQQAGASLPASDRSGAPELLAPAGSMAAFEAAVAAGADAIYVGAPRFNARNLARHFSFAELAAMVAHGHEHGVRVYAAMNSLVKEDEQQEALKTVHLLAGLGIDALIVQDLGLARMVGCYFPNLRLHASTLTGGHNSMHVRFLQAMGFARVVLARELTVAEIGRIVQRTAAEIEVFVHGALCFAYSGLCLFSSYLGGKSGLRGRCVQPCRRQFRWRNPAAGRGYFFSMNDLEGLEQLPALRRAGVRSFKIEGRMRSASYVSAVVGAYRLAIDDPAAVGQAKEQLALAMGRRSSNGYFSSPQPDAVLAPAHSGNIGQFLGKVTAVQGRWVTLVARFAIRAGDRLRLHHEQTGERFSLNLRQLKSRQKNVKTAPLGSTVSLAVDCPAAVGDSIYRVDTATGRERAATTLRPALFQALVKRLANNCPSLAGQGGTGAAPGRVAKTHQRAIAGRRPPRGRRRSPAPVWPFGCWLRLDSPALLRHHLPLVPDQVLIDLTVETLGRLPRRQPAASIWRKVIWALPPVIEEHHLAAYQDAVRFLLRQKFTAFQLAHPGQIGLFTAVDRGRHRQSLRLYGDYHFNIVNSSAVDHARQLGLVGAQLALESDRTGIGRCCRMKGKTALGLTVYATPALFTSRLAADHFRYDQPFMSPRGEEYRLHKYAGQTVAVPAVPFYLLDSVAELAELGLDYGVVDLRFSGVGKRAREAIFRMLVNPRHRPRKWTRFNYLGGLQ